MLAVDIQIECSSRLSYKEILGRVDSHIQNTEDDIINLEAQLMINHSHDLEMQLDSKQKELEQFLLQEEILLKQKF